MKRNLKLLLFALMVIPFVAKADMEGPTLRKFEVVVTAKDGVTCDSKTYKKGTVITVFGFKEDEGINTYYLNNSSCEISAEDVKLRKDSVAPTEKDITKAKKAIEGYITNEDGVDVRKGPDDMYTKVGHLDKGTKINYTYYYESEGWITNVYIDQNSVKGWIDAIDYNYEPTFKTVYTGSLKIITTKDSTKNDIKLPANTILDIKYNLTPHIENEVTPIVVYKDTEFDSNDMEEYEFISDSNELLFKFSRFEFTLDADTDVYTYIENKGDKLVTIPKGTKIRSISFIYDEAFSSCGDKENIYVEYNGKRGWIVVDENNYEEVRCGEEPTVTKTTKRVENEEKKSEEKKGLSFHNYIWAAIGGAIAAACGAFFLLIKNNKKNKENK